MSDILLIQLPIQKYVQKGFQVQNEFNPALGLLSLATILELHGRSVRIIDLFHEPIKKEDFISEIILESPKLIGISVYSENINMGIAFAKLIKLHLPAVKILLGGPHVSLDDTEFRANDCIDFIIINEGEGAILELTEALLSDETLINYNDISGLKFKRDGNIYENENRDFIKDLDILPIIKREFFSIEKYKKDVFLNISTSRGCPGQCIYCAATALSGGKYRIRNIKNVFLEMLLFDQLMGHVCFTIVDDSFTILKDRLRDFISLIKEYRPKFTWNCESRINGMNEEILTLMAESNCVGIQYGIESGDQNILDRIHKNIDLETAKEVIGITISKGIVVTAGFILGHYCDTIETMEKTIDLIKELKKAYGKGLVIGLSYNTPFPGTYQYKHKKELGINLETVNLGRFNMIEPVVNTDMFTVDDQRNYMYEVRDTLFQVEDLISLFK